MLTSVVMALFVICMGTFYFNKSTLTYGKILTWNKETCLQSLVMFVWKRNEKRFKTTEMARVFYFPFFFFSNWYRCHTYKLGKYCMKNSRRSNSKYDSRWKRFIKHSIKSMKYDILLIWKERLQRFENSQRLFITNLQYIIFIYITSCLAMSYSALGLDKFNDNFVRPWMFTFQHKTWKLCKYETYLNSTIVIYLFIMP